MQITIKSKQMDVSPRMRAHIEQKLHRLSRLISDEARLEVTVADEKTRSARDRYVVHLGISNVRGCNPIRATASNINVNAALDVALDKVTTQLGRHKDRQIASHRLPVSAVQVLTLSRSGNLSETDVTSFEDAALDSEENEQIWSRIMEIRRIATRAMNEQEVITQMEQEGLSFYPFINTETNSINVMYRLTAGEGYGLLLPATERVES
jgi:putative sigma-54 modulation protein